MLLNNSIPIQLNMVLNHLVLIFTFISSYHRRGKLSQFVVTQLCKQKELQLFNVVCTRAILWAISSSYIFSIRLKSFSFTLSDVQLKLVKFSVLWYIHLDTIHSTMYSVILRKTRIEEKHSASCCIDVILERTSLIWQNFLSFPSWGQPFTSYGESRKDRWLSKMLWHRYQLSW